MVRSGFCRMWVAGSWPGAGLHLAEAEWGLQLAIEQSKGARRTIDCTNLDQFRQRWGALGSWLTKVLRCHRHRSMLATAGMYAEDVSSNEVAILGKMSRGDSDIGDSGLAEIVALRHRDGCERYLSLTR
jgi:hypothetical protein